MFDCNNEISGGRWTGGGFLTNCLPCWGVIDIFWNYTYLKYVRVSYTANGLIRTLHPTIQIHRQRVHDHPDNHQGTCSLYYSDCMQCPRILIASTIFILLLYIILCVNISVRVMQICQLASDHSVTENFFSFIDAYK